MKLHAVPRGPVDADYGCGKCAFADDDARCRMMDCHLTVQSEENSLVAYVTEETFLKMRMRGEV